MSFVCLTLIVRIIKTKRKKKEIFFTILLIGLTKHMISSKIRIKIKS